MQFTIDSATLISSFAAVLIAILGWLFNRAIKANDDRMTELQASLKEKDEKLEKFKDQVNGSYVSRTDLTLLREETGRGFTALNSKLDDNKQLLLALVKKNTKD